MDSKDLFSAEYLSESFDNSNHPADSADTAPSVKSAYTFARRRQAADDSFAGVDETNVKTEKYGNIFNNIALKNNINFKSAEIMLVSIFESDSTINTHCKNVSVLCEAIARKMNLSRADINEIKTAGILHDIGKKEINETVLNKTGKLTDDELLQIKQHSVFGSRMLKSLNGFSRISDFVLEHHERWDGKGYPKGISGESISLQARIIAVADTFDAMTSDRPYKKAVSRDEAIVEIQANAGTQFDPSVVQAFLDVFKLEVLYA